MWLGPRPRQHTLPEERATARSGWPRADDLQHTTRNAQTTQNSISTRHRCNCRQHAGLGNSRAVIAECPVKCSSPTRFWADVRALVWYHTPVCNSYPHYPLRTSIPLNNHSLYLGRTSQIPPPDRSHHFALKRIFPRSRNLLAQNKVRGSSS